MPSAPATILRHSSLRAPPPHIRVRVTFTPLDFATSRQSRSANVTPSMTASPMSARVVSGRMPTNMLRASTSLCGLRSPIMYGRKYTSLRPSLPGIAACSTPCSERSMSSTHHLLHEAADSMQPMR